ncbi:MAG: hypothetical protein NTY11_01330 [Candidatus Parcubacteria bacterium]|nr:hypothetical protein [Candidatus Parcubacteria bacterium]
MTEESKKENQIKLAILDNLTKEGKRRKYVILGVIILFLILGIVLKPFPYFYYIAATLLLVLSSIILAISLLKKNPNNSLKKVRRTIGTIIFGELFILSISFYFFIPIAIFYQIRISIILIPFFLLYAVLIYPLFISKKINDLFYIFSFIVLTILTLAEYLGIYPSYSNYPISKDLIMPLHIAIIPISIAAITLLIIRNSMDYFWGRFSQMNIELKELNTELERKVKERTRELQKKSEELQEAKDVLEIKVRARTRELKEFAEELEQKIQLRTRELQERVDELEVFHKFTVNRELKMIELKEEISALKKELADTER